MTGRIVFKTQRTGYGPQRRPVLVHTWRVHIPTEDAVEIEAASERDALQWIRDSRGILRLPAGTWAERV